jgi:hypothetical protein
MTWGDWFRELTTGPLIGVIGTLAGVGIARWTTRSEGAANRADKRADQLREEVATVLAERPRMIDSQRKLFDATMRNREQREHGDVSPADRTAQLMPVRQEHIDLCDKVKHKVICAQLLTNSPRLESALAMIRASAENWNGPMEVTHRAGVDIGSDEFDRFDKLQIELANAFDELEASTRAITAVAF